MGAWKWVGLENFGGSLNIPDLVVFDFLNLMWILIVKDYLNCSKVWESVKQQVNPFSHLECAWSLEIWFLVAVLQDFTNIAV